MKSQILALKKLLYQAKGTAFGHRFDFTDLLKLSDPRKEFKTWIPIYQYDTMQKQWWYQCREDIADITWPGVIPYYGVSSGSTHSSSKYIPVSNESLKAWNKGSKKLFRSLLPHKEFNSHLLNKKALMVGGSTNLIKENNHFIGDNSGIIALHKPAWIAKFYKPEDEIQKLNHWDERIEQIIQKAPQWNIAYAVGNPAWIQLIFERIISEYKLNTIHDIWPSLSVLLHSGINFEPYKPSFELTLRKPLLYVNTYAATEAFMGFQTDKHDNSMQLILNNGVYFELLPFTNEYFDENGNLINSYCTTLNLEEAEPNKTYALVISTASGAWHYLLGDLVRFTDVNQSKIQVVGRTKANLNLTGEHVSIGNIESVIIELNKHLPVKIKEYTVVGERIDTHFGHHWYLGTDQEINCNSLATVIDAILRKLNDDYSIQRDAMLKTVKVTNLATDTFYKWLDSKNKYNGQSKITRILNSETMKDWHRFLKEEENKSVLSFY